MPSKKTFLLAAAFTVLTAASFSIFQPQPQPHAHFSNPSIEKLQALNSAHGMFIHNIYKDDSLHQELLRANITTQNTKRNHYQGIVASLNDDVASSTVLLIEPMKALSKEELSSLAEQYTSEIPEIEMAEVDQDIEMMSDMPAWLMSHPVMKEEPVQEEAGTVDSSSESKLLRVALLDSGVDTRHEIFASTSIATGYNSLNDSSFTPDDVGHGTHIAGIIALNSSGIELYPYKVVGKDGGRLSHVLKALEKVKEDDVDIVNLSFGFSEESFALKKSIDELSEDAIILAAAGNKSSNAFFYPAAYASTIAVGAVDVYGEKLPSANYGDWIDVAAYGYRIRSSIPGNQYGSLSGTSQATAFSSAFVISLLQDLGGEGLPFVRRVLHENGSTIADGVYSGKTLVEL